MHGLNSYAECPLCGAPLTQDEIESGNDICADCEWERAEQEAVERELDPDWADFNPEDR